MQYRNGAALAAATKVSINADGNLILEGNSVVRAANIANRAFLSTSDIYNTQTEFPLGISTGFSSQREWMAHGDSVSIHRKAWDATYSGTPVGVSMAVSTTLCEPQISYETAAAAGSVAGMVCTNPMIKGFNTGVGGLYATIRLRIPTLAAGQRWFVGLVNDLNAPTDQDPTTMTNFVGFGANAGDANLFWITRGTGTVTKNDMNMPNNLGGAFYTFLFYAPNGISNTTATVRNGPYNMGGSTTGLPEGRYYLKAWVSTGTSTTKTAINISRAYIEHIYNVY
ncbi:hypothetical protein NHF48_019755 [Sphingomonas sp. H160509]|uniref:hypothetical protein n=1 Tax=Sphingomonas sp. H160509 TaxID=2955313 RepID=UPI0021E8F862|nr:hypothetical protein [Sphingomonas sp. H160509]MDD1452654.1 hypothetical protein [Sphingomonas sp. H160509]